jgi:AraC-like DNA-binding protein
MSTAIAVCHGAFGRASLYFLDRPMIRHAHPDGHLIFHVNGPAQYLNLGERRCPISPEQGVGVNPWEPHDFAPTDERGQQMLVIYMKPAWFREFAGSGHRALKFGQPEIEITPAIWRCIERVVRLLLSGHASPIFDGALFELVQESFAVANARMQAGADRPGLPISDFRIRKSVKIMAEALPSEFNLDRVASNSGLSRPHFFKLFRDQFGIPPRLFWNSLRMERAIERLSATSKSVTEIGFEIGFPSQGSFSRFFAMNAGMAPSDYRRAGLAAHS